MYFAAVKVTTPAGNVVQVRQGHCWDCAITDLDIQTMFFISYIIMSTDNTFPTLFESRLSVGGHEIASGAQC